MAAISSDSNQTKYPQLGNDLSSWSVETTVLIVTFSFLKRRVTWDNPAILPSGNGGCLQPRANLPKMLIVIFK